MELEITQAMKDLVHTMIELRLKKDTIMLMMSNLIEDEELIEMRNYLIRYKK